MCDQWRLRGGQVGVYLNLLVHEHIISGCPVVGNGILETILEFILQITLKNHINM